VNTIKLGELVSITGGGTPDRSNPDFWEGNIPWATVKDFKTLEISSTLENITEEGLKGSAANVAAVGSIIVPTRMALGKAAINTVPVAINQDLKALRVLDPEVVDRDYLFRFLLSKSAYLESQGQGATVKGITLSVLRDLEVPVPPIREQQRIATILDKADNLRRKRQEAIRLADDFLRAVFYEKFGDPVTNTKGLPTSRIDQLCDVATGSTPARNRADYYNGPHPWIKTGEVDTPLITSAEEHISDTAIAETNCKIFPVGTLLIAMYGQGKTRGKVGMLGIPAATNQACAAILPSKQINRHFLYTQLSLMYEHLRAMGRGGNQENLNLGMIKSLEVLVPPLHLVHEFLKIREKVSEMNSKAFCAQAEAEAMSRSLAAKFFS
jgi:type I restriction enzyme, S subunit